MALDGSEAARIAELEADNKRLRRLLDQRDAPGELRHRLRTTVAMLRIIIRKSAHTPRTIDDYVGHLEDRLDALARAQGAADEHGSVALHMLLADELLYCGATEGERATLDGPDVELEPRAGRVFALAVHELAVNAVEHGALGTGDGRVDVQWRVAADVLGPILTFTWRERGRVDPSRLAFQGFGTEVLTQVLSYELKAETDLDMAPHGLRCTIRFPLVERVGRLADG